MPDFNWDTAAPRERDAWIAVNVVGEWEIRTVWQGKPEPRGVLVSPGGKRDGWWKSDGTYCDWYMSELPDFTTDAAADYRVLEQVRDGMWIDEREDVFNRFWTNLAEILRSRDPYYRDTVNQRELYYMLEYRPGDYSHAAYLAITRGST